MLFRSLWSGHREGVGVGSHRVLLKTIRRVMGNHFLYVALGLPFLSLMSGCSHETVAGPAVFIDNSLILLDFDNKPLDCGSASRYEYLKMLSVEEAPADAESAIDRKDYRFLAVDGYGRSMPGTEAYMTAGEKYYGYRVISGTSDMLCDAEHGELNGNARRYAEIYNREIIRRLRQR